MTHSDKMALQVCGHHIQPSTPQNDTASNQKHYYQHQRTGLSLNSSSLEIKGILMVWFLHRMIYLHLTQKANESHLLWLMSEYMQVEEKEKQLCLGLALDFWWFTWIY
uniref:Uncharacterized protein n=1 Tax=Solanum lycopersicum TaxID=4081 RepID=A0A3Q7F7U2_SOLLC